MPLQGLDYTGLSPNEVKARGASFVMRYLSYTPYKNLTRNEAEELKKLGIKVGVVWETTADRALSGYGAGEADAHEALRQAIECGMVGAWGITAAVDFDTNGSPQRTDPYFDGWAAYMGHARTGPYGGYEVVRHHANRGHKALWQTYAWSGGRWDSRAEIQQYNNNNSAFDLDRTTGMANHLLWFPGVPTAAPSPHDHLMPKERGDVDLYLRLKASRAWTHPVAIAKVKGRLEVYREDIWRAAVKGILPDGSKTTLGWNVNYRGARYEILKRIVPIKKK